VTETVVRRAVCDDTTAVTLCVERAYTKYIPLLGQRPGPMTEDYRRVIAEHEVYVASDGGQLCGVLVLIPHHHHLLLDNIAIDPAAQGRGIGGRLFALAEQRTRELGLSAIELYTHVCMTGNQSLYPALGYRETRRVREKGFDRIYYRKQLH